MQPPPPPGPPLPPPTPGNAAATAAGYRRHRSDHRECCHRRRRSATAVGAAGNAPPPPPPGGRRRSRAPTRASNESWSVASLSAGRRCRGRQGRLYRRRRSRPLTQARPRRRTMPSSFEQRFHPQSPIPSRAPLDTRDKGGKPLTTGAISPAGTTAHGSAERFSPPCTHVRRRWDVCRQARSGRVGRRTNPR